MCSKHIYYKTRICALSWSVTKSGKKFWKMLWFAKNSNARKRRKIYFKSNGDVMEGLKVMVYF